VLSTYLLLLSLTGTSPAATLQKDIRSLNGSLRDYKTLKSREAILRIKIARGTTSQKDEFNREFDSLKPKIYDAAQVMEHQVQDFERNYGAKKLCESLTAENKTLVPACLHPQRP
jgi:hypothetical protein